MYNFLSQTESGILRRCILILPYNSYSDPKFRLELFKVSESQFVLCKRLVLKLRQFNLESFISYLKLEGL